MPSIEQMCLWLFFQFNWLYIKCYFKYNGCVTYFLHYQKHKITFFKWNWREASQQISKTNFSVPCILKDKEFCVRWRSQNINFSYLPDFSFWVIWKNALPVMAGKYFLKTWNIWNTKNFHHNYRLNFSKNSHLPEMRSPNACIYKKGTTFQRKQKFDSKTQDMFDNLQQKCFFKSFSKTNFPRKG